jgi:glycosyltransferase involved in cell wall biosynthesis
MQKKRIALIHYSCPPTIGGVEAVIENHALLFRHHGYPVKVIVGAGEEFAVDIPVTVVPEMGSTFPRNLEIQKKLGTQAGLTAFHVYKNTIKQKLIDALDDVDVVFAHNVISMHFNLALSTALMEIIRERRFNIRWFAWCHDHTFIDVAYAKQSQDTYPWNVIKTHLSGVHYVTISAERNRQLARLFNVPAARITTIQNGIYLQDFLQLDARSDEIVNKYHLLDQDVVFLAPSRIVRRKNIELSIRITAAVKKLYHLKVLLIITGPPDPHNPGLMEYYRFLHQVARRERCTANVVFLYEHLVEKKYRLRVNKLIVRDLYLFSDCLLFPSFMEGFGIPLLEAGLMKRPVVCSNIPSHALIGGDDVMKIDPYGDPRKLARLIMTYLERDITRPLFKRVLKEYAWKRIFKEKILPLLKA